MDQPPCWRTLSSKLRANCIFNYNVPPAPIRKGEPVSLSLFLGDPVVILAEVEDWFYGHTLSNDAHKGVFPKAYVHLSSSHSHQEPLVDEINSSLKEWNEIMKKKYLRDDSSSVTIIRGIMRDVTSMRSSLATGKLTEEEAKETRQRVVNKTDFLNNRLGLDLVVRDTNGSVLPPERYDLNAFFNHE